MGGAPGGHGAFSQSAAQKPSQALPAPVPGFSLPLEKMLSCQSIQNIRQTDLGEPFRLEQRQQQVNHQHERGDAEQSVC